MALAIGMAMIFAAFLIGRIAKTGGRMQPPPFWNHDNLNGFVVVPGIVILLAAGIATDWDWAASRGWRTSSLTEYLSALAAVAVFVVLWRLITAWQRKVLPAGAAAPSASPIGPALKKAA